MARGILYVIVDGAHARLVARSSESGDYVTLHAADGAEALQVLRAELNASPAGRSHESGSPSRSAVGEVGAVRQAKEDFVETVADAVVHRFAAQAERGVVLIAPQRLIATLRERLAGHVKIVGELQKDLTKIPDHELKAHLSQFRLAEAP